ncbi:MAG: hypothetical protein AAFW76_05855, partial [Pseudomonadota bacterium]
AENEQLRGMLHTLLLAVEKDGDAIGPVLRDLEQAVSAISAAGVPQSADPGESGEVLAEAPAEPELAQPDLGEGDAPVEALVAESDEPAEMPAADEPPAPAAEPESETVFSSDQDLDTAPDDVALDEEPEPVAEDLAVDAAEAEDMVAGDMVAEDPAIEEPAVEEPLDDAPMAALEMDEADAIDLEIDEIEPVEDTAETDLVADGEAPSDNEAPGDDEALADDTVAELLMESDDAEGPEAGADEDILTDLDIEDLAADALVEEEEPAEEALVPEEQEAEGLVEDGLVLEDIEAEPDLVADAEAPPEPEAADLEAADLEATEPEAAEPEALASDEIETLLVDDVEESDDNAIDLEFEASIEAETPPDLIAPVEEDEVDLLADEAIEEALLTGADDEEEVSMQALAEQLRQKNEAMANGAESANQGG